MTNSEYEKAKESLKADERFWHRMVWFLICLVMVLFGFWLGMLAMPGALANEVQSMAQPEVCYSASQVRQLVEQAYKAGYASGEKAI